MTEGGAKVFLRALKEQTPHYAISVEKLAEERPASFYAIGDRLTGIIARVHPDDWLDRLIDGYAYFVTDVMRSQALYEQTGAYEKKSQADILNGVYRDEGVMRDYHWGMLATLFCWQHHLELAEGFLSRFMPRFGPKGPTHIIDLGCGSGAWSLLALQDWSHTVAELVDISPWTIAETRQTVEALALADRAALYEADVTSFKSASGMVPALISAFVAAHLENPQAYFDRIGKLLEPGGKAYIIVALNAAEIDHIYEFKRESEPIFMAEQAGLTLLDAQLARPKTYSTKAARSFAMILERREGDTSIRPGVMQ